MLPQEKRAKDPADRGAALKRAAAIRGTRERIKRNKIKCKRALLAGGEGEGGREGGVEQSRMRFYFRLNSEARPTFFLPSSSRSRPPASHPQRRYATSPSLHHHPPPYPYPTLPPPPPSPPPSISFRKVSFSRPRHGHHGRFYHRADGIACNPRYTASSPPCHPHLAPATGSSRRAGEKRDRRGLIYSGGARCNGERERAREREREREREGERERERESSA